MLRPRKTVDADRSKASFDDLQGALRREAEGAGPDPSDDVMMAAVTGLADLLKAEAGVLAAMGEDADRTVRDVKRRARRDL